jgi:hypothetical protein
VAVSGSDVEPGRSVAIIKRGQTFYSQKNGLYDLVRSRRYGYLEKII